VGAEFEEEERCARCSPARISRDNDGWVTVGVATTTSASVSFPPLSLASLQPLALSTFSLRSVNALTIRAPRSVPARACAPLPERPSRSSFSLFGRASAPEPRRGSDCRARQSQVRGRFVSRHASSAPLTRLVSCRASKLSPPPDESPNGLCNRPRDGRRRCRARRRDRTEAGYAHQDGGSSCARALGRARLGEGVGRASQQRGRRPRALPDETDARVAPPPRKIRTDWRRLDADSS
jgi:hypothetical protein